MSFTGVVKDEVTRYEGNKLEYIAELSCIVRNNADISDDIVIVVENNSVARRIFKLIKSIYDVSPIITVRRRYNFNHHLSYSFPIIYLFIYQNGILRPSPGLIPDTYRKYCQFHIL